jgi:hypothetical protein
VPSEWRLQSQSNRQASDGLLGNPDRRSLSRMLEDFYDEAYNLYEIALDYGVAPSRLACFSLVSQCTTRSWAPSMRTTSCTS